MSNYAVNWPLQGDSPPQTARTGRTRNGSRGGSDEEANYAVEPYEPYPYGFAYSSYGRSGPAPRTDVDFGVAAPAARGAGLGGGMGAVVGTGLGYAATTTTAVVAPAVPHALDEKNIMFSPRSERIVFEKNNAAVTQVVGTTNLYEDGKIRLIPMPTPDPKDPLNLPTWRKWLAVSIICVFGSLALSAELVIASLLPVFVLDYASPPVPVTLLNDGNATVPLLSAGSAAGLNPLALIPPTSAPPPLDRVVLLATIPLIANSAASYLLVPLSVAVGRRPVLIVAAACAWAGGLWAGFSTSLTSHIAARALQGLGAGAVEALIPLVIQDLVFIHQRNLAMSGIVTAQGVFVVGLGVAAPYVASRYTWRWLYFITSGAAFLTWLAILAGVPETRWTRSLEELQGARLFPMRKEADRPDLDEEGYGPRTRWTDFGLFQFGFEWREAGASVITTIKSTFFPTVLWAVAANTVFLVASQAAGQIGSFALLAQGWQFQFTGLSVIPFIGAGLLAFAFAGPLADKVSNAVTKWNGGNREPEHHLLNLVFPFFAGILGCFIFGYAGENNLHWAVLLVGAFLILFGSLAVLTVVNVFIVESYPMWAGPVLVNVSSMRLLVGFFLGSQATNWITRRGMLGTFAIYAEAMIVISLGIPALYFCGKRLRKWTGGKVHGVRIEKRIVTDEAGSGVVSPEGKY